MYQEFNKVSTTSNLIKNLLISTYLPLVRTVRDYDYILVDRLYIYKCNIIKCTKSGYIVTGYQYANFDGERATFRVVAEYYFGERNDKLCTNYISNTEGYDYITHERLGKYLRSLRDMYDLNLMPLYNCFSNQIFQAHHIINSGDYTKDKIEKTSTDYGTKIYKVPIRFNTDYTICMENLGKTTFAPAFIKNNNLIKLNNNKFGNNVDVTNKYSRLYRTGVISTLSGLRFRDPVKIRFNNIPCTKTLTWTSAEYTIIDAIHDPRYYKVCTSAAIERTKYYLKNEGYYEVANIDASTFAEDPTLYYYNNNGILTQCESTSTYDPSKVYYVYDSTILSNTYMPTSLKPDNNPNGLTLYIGVEPASGRIDAGYDIEEGGSSGGIEYDEENKALIQTITSEDLPTLSVYDMTLSVSIYKERHYDSADYETVCLWRRCTNQDEYDSSETYYTRESGVFYEWNYILSEEDYEKNPSSYYTYDESTGEYIACTSGNYDASETYYVSYLDKYITVQEYYFIFHTTEFYIALGFDEEVKQYYLYDGNTLVPYTSSVFDINATYLVKKDREFFPWKLKSSDSYINSTDTYIKEGVTYYTSYTVNTEYQYIYDITEENCQLYDMIEDNLYLLIQVDKNFDSNIVVLEGDYTSTESTKILDDAQVDLLPKPMVDYLYTSNLKLMDLNTNKVIPFSPALVEFLLWNAINNLDSINNNLDRLTLAMDKILSDSSTLHYTNFWYPDFRKLVYQIGRDNNNIPVRDNLGYVTKNLEQVIFTTKNNESYINDYETIIDEEM